MSLGTCLVSPHVPPAMSPGWCPPHRERPQCVPTYRCVGHRPLSPKADGCCLSPWPPGWGQSHHVTPSPTGGSGPVGWGRCHRVTLWVSKSGDGVPCHPWGPKVTPRVQCPLRCSRATLRVRMSPIGCPATLRVPWRPSTPPKWIQVSGPLPHHSLVPRWVLLPLRPVQGHHRSHQPWGQGTE